MLDSNSLYVKDENGNEKRMTILFIVGVAKFCDEVYKLFGFEYHVELSTRPEDSMGTDEEWEMVEEVINTFVEDNENA